MMLTTLAALLAMNIAPVTPVPSADQLAWHRLEYYAFTHFGPNTFTGNEWGKGTEDPKLFNPTDFDADQWARTFKAAGMKGIIITAKHHDGFCLWPSKFSTHTVAQSPWKNGKGDVLREVSDACRRHGLKFGVYLSPWDRNHPAYGTPEYNQIFMNTLREVLTNYGEVFEVWFDGANGEGPNGKRQVYDFPAFHKVVRELQPKALIFSDAGPDIRWIGNEAGYAGETNWAMQRRDEFRPGMPGVEALLNTGQIDGTHWVPGEADVSIRPGWFYRPSEDSKVKTLDQLRDIWYGSVGRGSNLLLNVPPDTRGRIHENDVKALMQLRGYLDKTFGDNLVPAQKGPLSDEKEETFWSAAAGARTGTATVDLGKPTRLDVVEAREPIALGQRVKAFRVEAETEDGWQAVARGTTIGYRRTLRIEPVVATRLRWVIEDSRDRPLISEIAAYATPQVNRESAAEKAKRMKWFNDARFGMFVHWGLYSIPGGQWKGKSVGGIGEWIMNNGQIPVADYQPLQKQFNPVKYDARAWVKAAKAAGMKYIVITSKHHDGFCLWDSKLTDWDIAGTPYKRDLLRQLSDACKAEGITLGFYHSIMDWTHPDYLPRRAWDPRPGVPADFDRYERHLRGQLKELLTNYDIKLLWFDGEWENTWTHERGRALYDWLRQIRPDIIINNRVDKGRAGMAGMTSGDHFAGDYGTPEQEVPASGFPEGVYWESCMTMNDTWGFRTDDQNWKSAKTILHTLLDIASKGGNYLLNVGPTAEGEIPAPSLERMAEVGKWMKKNGEAVYGTSAGPFPKALPWGRVTRKGSKLYLSVFDAGSGQVTLPGLKANIRRAYPLGQRGTALTVQAVDGSPVVKLNVKGVQPMAEVFVVEFAGALTVEKTPITQAADASLTLDAIEAEATNGIRFEDDKKALGFWTSTEGRVTWDFVTRERGNFTVEVELACEDTSAGATFEVAVGGSRVTGTVPATGGWAKFQTVKLGRISLIVTGPEKLEVRALQVPKGAVMNLRRVRLVRE